MNWLQIFFTIYFCLWMAAILVFLWLIWRSTVLYTRRLEKVLVDLATKNAEAVKSALEKKGDAH